MTATARIITADELARDLDTGAIVEFWNVLTDDYFTGQMIPGSRRVPLDQVGRHVARASLAPDTPIAVYCSGPTCPQSGQAGAKLATLGFTNIRVFEGGLAEWRASGRPLVAEEAAV